MNPDALKVIFQAKNARRQELAAMPIGDKFRLIEALHKVGMHLRKARPQIGSFGVDMAVRSTQSAKFESIRDSQAKDIKPEIRETQKTVCALPFREAQSAA